MPRLVSHSGGCCGRKCIYEFGNSRNPEEDLTSLLEQANGRCTVRGQITEVVLTTRQLSRKPELREALDKCGFKLVFKGVNNNTGNMLNVFMHHPRPSRL